MKQSQPDSCIWQPSEPAHEEWMELDRPGKKRARLSVLLHSCCGPCSTACVERLAPDYQVTIYFYNPCITEEQEYQKRKEHQIRFIRAFNRDSAYEGQIGFMEGPYDKARFYRVCRGLEQEPEGGKRCQECFLLRLDATAQEAAMQGYDLFTTTLTVSPHKDYDTISRIGKRMAARYSVGFLDINFKKKSGFQRSVALSKKYGLYRQDYCGCEFSNYHLKEQEEK